MSAAFTPGPWQRKNDYTDRLVIIGNVDGESFSDGTESYTYDFIANCEDEYGEATKPANVRLILAAPALLVALEKARNTLAGCGMANIAADICDGALAQALGETVSA